MTRETNQLTEEITRRNALKAGVTVSSGLVFGGAAIGTVGASGSVTTRAFPVHHFVRAEGDGEPSPIPDPQDKLVERRGGNPVDDGVVADELDGTHQLTWGEFSALDGVAKIACDGDDTEVVLEMAGLVPGALYTIWVVVFEDSGFNDTRNLTKAFENLVGAGPLGTQDGSENAFRPTGGTARIEAIHPSGPLAIFDYDVDCLLEEFEVHLVAAFHLDDAEHGSVPGPAGTVVEHVGFKFGTGI